MDEPTPDPAVIILGVDFAEGYDAIKIRYVETRNVGPKAFKDECITLEKDLVNEGELTELIDTLLQFLDVGLLHLRTEGGG